MYIYCTWVYYIITRCSSLLQEPLRWFSKTRASVGSLSTFNIQHSHSHNIYTICVCRAVRRRTVLYRVPHKDDSIPFIRIPCGGAFYIPTAPVNESDGRPLQSEIIQVRYTAGTMFFHFVHTIRS